MAEHRITTERREVLLAEYSAANAVYLTYDGFRWQSGTFLVAGVFVYWGFLITSSGHALLVDSAAILISALMSCWLFFAHHYRQLYMFKIERLQEIEELLGMEQNRRMRPRGPQEIFYKATWPKGHNIDIAVYIFTTLGSVWLGVVRHGFSWPEFLVVLGVVAVVVVVFCNEHRLRVQINDTRKLLIALDAPNTEGSR
ncbi:MAG: hypothetical protein JWN80_834 [Microbacteriaceae bacterium]|nr:hypothetical protein [Microbacteriaceae bacterium]